MGAGGRCQMKQGHAVPTSLFTRIGNLNWRCPSENPRSLTPLSATSTAIFLPATNRVPRLCQATRATRSPACPSSCLSPTTRQVAAAGVPLVCVGHNRLACAQAHKPDLCTVAGKLGYDRCCACCVALVSHGLYTTILLRCMQVSSQAVGVAANLARAGRDTIHITTFAATEV